MADLKSTHLFEAGGHHEIAYGWHPEYVTYDQERWYSGPLGQRQLVQLYPSDGYHNTYSFFTLQQGQQPSDIGTAFPATDLLYPPLYQDSLKANVSSLVNALFLQENYNPQGLRNLTVNLGARLEFQKLYDFHGKAFLDATNISPRIGAVYDPFSDGRSKLSFFYGRYYEAIPLNVAARYFGGEGILVRNGIPFAGCANSQPYTWTGAGEASNCGAPPMSTAGQPFPADNATGGSTPQNNGTNYPVQKDLAGQYHNEIVATAEREIIEDLTVRLDYQHRWLGRIIEDGTADPGAFTFVLANPGDVPKSALDEARTQRDMTRAAVAAVSDPMDPSLPALTSAANAAQAKLDSLTSLAAAPKPERTYDAITVSVNKRFSKNWLTRAAYTYSRLIGNYDGLYQAEQNYFAPNGSNAYDTPDLVREPERAAAQRPAAPRARRRLLHAPPRRRLHHPRPVVRGALGHAAELHLGAAPGPEPDHAAAARLGRADADHDRAERQDRLPPPAFAQGEPGGVHRPVQHLQPAGGGVDRRRLHLQLGRPDRERHPVRPEVRQGHLGRADRQERELRPRPPLSAPLQRPLRPAPDVLASFPTAC